jgi:hypothetical protein
MADEQHIYHHNDSDGIRVSVKVERNTKGYNWEASVSGAKTVEDALKTLQEVSVKMAQTYGKGEIT